MKEKQKTRAVIIVAIIVALALACVSALLYLASPGIIGAMQ